VIGGTSAGVSRARVPPRAWLVVAALFVTLFFIWGSGYNTAGVFFTPVIRSFGWSRARLSTLQTALALAAGVSVPLIGWILDRVEARLVIAAGALTAATAFVLASLAHSYEAMLGAYLLLGVGVGGATLLPCSMVIANWFGARRGLAMGITMAGTSVGGMVMTLISDRVIRLMGWRFGYLTLAVPVVLIVAPAVLLIVRTRPTQAAHAGVAQAASALPGMEAGAALASRSFWMLAAATLCFAVAVSGTNLHCVPYLIGAGYAPARAALAFSVLLAFGGIGKLTMGWIADRAGARAALSGSLLGMAAGITLLMGARSELPMAGFVAIYGLTFGAPLALLPLVMAESMGLRRFGSLYGLIGFFHTAGAAIGPVIAGRIFDLRGSYSYAFATFVGLLIVGSAATLACVPPGAEQPAELRKRSSEAAIN
jgi:MFS family permease